MAMAARPLLLLLALLLAAAPRAAAARDDDAAATLPVPTFRLDLTLRAPERRALRGGMGGIGGMGDEDAPEAQRDLRSLDGAIQTAAEAHLLSYYAAALAGSPPPSEVLLTVVTDADADADDASGRAGGISVRSSFVGGVARFPRPAPLRGEVARATLRAFRVPGAGEDFLKALQDREGEHPRLAGLLLIGAEEVNRYDDDDGVKYQPAVRHEEPAPYNVWAVAAVAALGAMFVVIVLCTGLLYCDWRKRRDKRELQREAARERRAARGGGGASYRERGGRRSEKSRGGGTSAASAGAHSAGGRASGGGESAGSPEVMAPPELISHSGEFDITVQASRSGETELVSSPASSGGPVYSPSSAGGGSAGLISPVTNGSANQGSAGSGRGSVFQKLKSTQIGRPHLLRAKSSAAASSLGASAGSPGDPQARMLGSSYGAALGARGVPVSPSGDSELFPTLPPGGEHRSRLPSYDGASDFDGYSMDGASALAGHEDRSAGGSRWGGSAERAAGGVAGVSKKRDVMYTGEIPRDFDSVWGDDDQSKITVEGSILENGEANDGGNGDGGAAYYPPGSPGFHSNLQELTEGVAVKDVPSAIGTSADEGAKAAAGVVAGGDQSTVNLGEFDSESESGSRGAFTLELLGKGPSYAKTTSGMRASGVGSVSPSQDDEDSILGVMYRDDGSTPGGDEAGGDGDGGGGDDDGGASVDSTPSWAAPIETARMSLRKSLGIFREGEGEGSGKAEGDNEENGAKDDSEGTSHPPASSPLNKDDADDNHDKENEAASDRSIQFAQGRASAEAAATSMKETQEQRTRLKLMSSLSVSSTSDEGSVGSYGSKDSRKETTAASAKDRALGLTNSKDEEIDQDPAVMIDSINSMLSECREILDTEEAA